MRDPLSIRKNVYRVLMTRGRDGTMVFRVRGDGTAYASQCLNDPTREAQQRCRESP